MGLDQGFIPFSRGSGSSIQQQPMQQSMVPQPSGGGNLFDQLLMRLSNWPQYDPNAAGINPTSGPFIPMAPVPQMTPTTNFAAQQMAPYGDTQSAGTMAGVKPAARDDKVKRIQKAKGR